MIPRGNHRLGVAVMAVRIDRNPATMSELYDALNARASRRAAHLTREQERACREHYAAQIRIYGRVEVPWAMA